MALILPPDIDIKGPDGFGHWVNAYQGGLWASCQNIDQTAIWLHAAMVQALVEQGLDQSGRFGGSSASKAASTVTDKLRRASQNLNSAIILMKGAKAAAEKNVDAPIALAIAARANARSGYSVTR